MSLCSLGRVLVCLARVSVEEITTIFTVCQ
jgi:hypothetical protein